MNNFAVYWVLEQHVENLRQEAALRRRFPNQAGLGQRVISVLRAVRTSIASPNDETSTLTPALTDYPYRS